MAMNLLTALFSTVPRNKIVPASINGMLSWGLYLLLKDHIESVFYLLVVVASFTAAYSEVAAKIAKTPATVFLLPGLIPLIPGGFVYYAMLGLVQNQFDTMRQNALLAGQWAVGIAAGICVVAVIRQIIRHLTNR